MHNLLSSKIKYLCETWDPSSSHMWNMGSFFIDLSILGSFFFHFIEMHKPYVKHATTTLKLITRGSNSILLIGLIINMLCTPMIDVPSILLSFISPKGFLNFIFIFWPTTAHLTSSKELKLHMLELISTRLIGLV